MEELGFSKVVNPQNYTYHEFEIKKKSGKTRKIVNPSPQLKKYQRSKIKYLNKAFFKLAGTVQSCFHGFLPHRNSVTAAHFHTGFHSTTMFDFANFFDSITIDHLIVAGLWLDDKDKDYLLHKEGYPAQGFPSSPMLANIAIIPFMRDLRKYLRETCTRKGFALTVFADDIQISLAEEHDDKLKTIKQKVHILAETHKLTINPNKTRTRYAKYGSRRVLGVNVNETDIAATRKTNRKVRAVKQQVEVGKPQGQVLGGLRTWQKCHYPKGVDYIL